MQSLLHQLSLVDSLQTDYQKGRINAEKQCSIQNNLQKLIVNDKETTDETEILNLSEQFYETFFKKQSLRSEVAVDEFLNTLNVPNLSKGYINLCERDMKRIELKMIHWKVWKMINDGLSEEFLWNLLESD